MQIPVWKEGMTAEQGKDIAYAERNILALWAATQLNRIVEEEGHYFEQSGWYYDTDNNWEDWKRVISLDGGKVTFHIPDDFPVGNLPQIEPNWDGHTTEEKWKRMLKECGVNVEEEHR